MKNNLILTYSTNQTELTSLTYPFLERYCESHNIDLMIMRESAQNLRKKFETDQANWIVGSDRWFAYDLYKIYDRILWVGSDVLIKPNSPNIFEVVPKGNIGGYVEHKRGEFHHAGNICGDVYNGFGILPENYINIDVMLVDSTEKELFNYNNIDLKLLNKSKWAEQDYFNYVIHTQNLPLFDLGYKWNCMVSKYLYTNTPIPDDWYFMHVTGIPREERIKLIYSYLIKNEMI
jgi:lipopolysaccharide biosynthesis glycosyltransferase